MSGWLFFFSSGIVPFAAIAIFAPMLRRKMWARVAIATALVMLIYYFLARENFSTVGTMIRAVNTGLLAFGMGYVYQRFFWKMDHPDDPN